MDMIRNQKEYQQKDEMIFSVSDYIKILNEGLKNFKAKIVGEVSEAYQASSGHVYFSLKDEKDGSVIKCIIWKYEYGVYGIKLKEGVKIIASGHPQIYPVRGNFSFIAKVIEHAGEGTLKKEYEKLKKKLTEQGLFDEERKRKIPAYPQKIGVITSLKGAVIADFSNNLGKFGFKVKMVDSRVEGQTAITDLLSSIKTFKKKNIEVLVIIRGGGSLESMTAFNNERLVREVVDFPIPVIVGIGHDKDVPLVSLAADASVSTPTAAAVLLNESWKQAALSLERYEKDIIMFYESALRNSKLLINDSINMISNIRDLISNKYRGAETALKISFQKFSDTLQNKRINIRNLLDKSVSGFESLLSKNYQHLEHINQIIHLNNPERQLNLGYSITRSNGKIIKSVRNAKIGEDVDIRVMDGIIVSKIKNINKINKNKND